VDVSTIVVSYNTGELTKDCLESVFEKTVGVDFEVIVVDNASADGSAAMITEFFPEVKLIESSRNLGFAAANNLAFRRATGKYVFLLNPDTVLLNNAIRLFCDFMESSKHDKVGAVGAYLRDGDMNAARSYYSFPSLRTLGGAAPINRFRSECTGAIKRGLERAAGPDTLWLVTKWLSRIRNRNVRNGSDTGVVQVEGHFRARSVDYVIGAGLFMSRAVLDKVGFFDERFFVFMEEADLQYRMHRQGYARLVIEGPSIVHLGGRSASPESRRKMMRSSTEQFLRKHFPIKYAAHRLACGLSARSSCR